MAAQTSKPTVVLAMRGGVLEPVNVPDEVTVIVVDWDDERIYRLPPIDGAIPYSEPSAFARALEISIEDFELSEEAR